MLIKKVVARPSPPPKVSTTVIIEVDTIKSPEPRPATPELEYPGRALISEEMRKFINYYLQKYTDKYGSVPIGIARYRGDLIYLAGNVQIFRSQIDKLLMDQYLDNNHIEAFTIMLAEKNKLRLGHYHPFIFISSLHWGSTLYKYESKRYVSHISKESIRAFNFLLMPVADQSHWTLLVGDLKSLAWIFFDFLPNSTHRAVLLYVIYTEQYRAVYNICTEWYLAISSGTKQYHKEDYFEGDIRNWHLSIAAGIPTQTNGFDCGMFVCKYMEYIVLPRAVTGKNNYIGNQICLNTEPNFHTQFYYHGTEWYRAVLSRYRAVLQDRAVSRYRAVSSGIIGLSSIEVPSGVAGSSSIAVPIDPIVGAPSLMPEGFLQQIPDHLPLET
ncbi:hypothetical protein IEQ34_019881 [Dendrobium chrysotoxum]|uniref:Ubiquitin-like protease family profile domain-containing protein n=1 Tax=Dendrobium chrysotoxum TaxID=161865 RepID=A0AAV7GAN2_DENCH|nr:hypothetical protein IEQ34_019881 [Dendrobium chrysotoxum]